MTKQLRHLPRWEYRLRMAFGWMAWAALVYGRISVFSRVGYWLLPHAGFYAYDEGYEPFFPVR